MISVKWMFCVPITSGRVIQRNNDLHIIYILCCTFCRQFRNNIDCRVSEIFINKSYTRKIKISARDLHEPVKRLLVAISFGNFRFFFSRFSHARGKTYERAENEKNYHVRCSRRAIIKRRAIPTHITYWNL